ncbi:MAG: hypothetical protein JSR17_03160 [Proteobacteria bacterium]|nr:hypothetical protein [Pseudomonadota bacterium]
MLSGSNTDVMILETPYRARISQYGSQLLNFLLADDKHIAMDLLNTFSSTYDRRDDLDDTIQVICDVLDRVLQQQEATFPRRLPPARTFSIEEQDKVMSQLLDMNVIWFSDLYNFSQNIRENNGIENFEMVKQTQAYKLHQAIKNGSPEALTLIESYFRLFSNEKFRIEMASRILEMILQNKYSNKEIQKAIATVLLNHGAQVHDHNIDELNYLDDTHRLTDLASSNQSRTAYRYLIG